MLDIILCGCNGRMGRVITGLAAARCDCRIVGGFDINTESHAGFPVYANPANARIQADCIIDFSHPSGLKAMLAYTREHKIPAVVATTGLSEEQIALIHSAAADIPVFFSANMSLGINLMLELCKKAASILGGSFDIEILERHHNQKIDAPSGTALMLADALRDGLEYSPKYVFERHSRREKREAEEIGISAIRGGTIVGEHEIIFAGHDEVFTISHAAHSKEIFANGALNAAFYLKGKAPGMYAMKDLVEAR